MAKENEELQKAAQTAVSRPSSNPFGDGKLTTIQAFFGRYEDACSLILPKKSIEGKRILAIASQVVWQNKDLQACDPATVLGAMFQCAVTGLNPSPQYGEVYFVPYGQGKNQDGSWKPKTLQMQMGYRGWVKLAHKSGLIESVNAEAVYAGDEFEHWLGVRPGVNHKPGPNYGNPEHVTHAYAVVYYRGVTIPKLLVLNRNQIERLRAKSPMQKNGISGPWQTDYDQMAKAKAVKQLLKLVPMEDEWRDFHGQDEALAPSLEDFRRDGTGTRIVEGFEYPQEPSTEQKAEIVE